MNNTSNIKHNTSAQLKLSFIVPVYNVEKYLRKCVNSLLAQDYSDYEIILVDDGSTDGSGEMCDEIVRESRESRVESQEHPLVRVIHQPNGGLSAARNRGLKEAKGKYVCFVDSDDYWEVNVLGELMEQVERDKLDVLRFNYQNVRLVRSEGMNVEGMNELTNERYEVFSPNKNPKRDVDYREDVTDGETFLNERLGPSCYAVMFIIKRSLLVKNERVNELTSECLFTEGIYFEDVDWTPRMLVRAKRVASTQTVVYNYLWRTGSITVPTNKKKREKVLHDKILLLRGFKEQSRLVKDPKWFTWMMSFTTMSILGLLVSLSYNERRDYIEELKSLNVFPLSTIRTNRNERIKIYIANLSPYLYCKIMSFKK